MTGVAPHRLAGHLALLDPAGVLMLPEMDTLVVADLHLEKGSQLRPARHDAAALRYWRDVEAPCRDGRLLAPGAAWWRSATASMTMAAPAG